jgi:thioredoxin 1
MLIEITSKAQLDEILANTNKPVMVDFYAPWCGPCKMAMPAVEYLANTYDDDFVIAKANIEENAELTVQYNIMKIPTFLFFKDGEMKDKMAAGDKDIRRSLMESKLNALK